MNVIAGPVVKERTGRTMTYSLYDSHVASLLDEAVYHAEHLRLGAPDERTQSASSGTIAALS